jgi:hypothetical protein
MAQAFDGAVVEVLVRHHEAVGQRGRIDGVAVVLRGDLDLAGGAVEHRLVAAVVPELHLVGLAAEHVAEDLVAEADAEHRQLLRQHLRGSIA